MTNDRQISLINYIWYSLIGAWKFVQTNPKAMDYLDLTADGFWKSFWAIAVMCPLLLFQILVYSNSEVGGVSVSNIIFFFMWLPFHAFVMYYFTRFMKIDKNYASMIVATNWVSAITTLIVGSMSLLIITVLQLTPITTVVLFILFVYFNVYIGWFTYKVSLGISGGLAAGVLIFTIVLSVTVQALLTQVIDPEAMEQLRQMQDQINNQPS